MLIYEIRKRFFEENPNACANFTYNEKLNKIICYTYNFFENSNSAHQIDLKTKQQIALIKPEQNPFSTVLKYFTLHGCNQQLLDLISDYYYESIVSNKTFSSTDEVCDEINNYSKSLKNNVDSSNKNKALITACFVNEDGELSNTNIFYMELSFLTSKNNTRVCKIENAFTNDKYYGNGLHTYGIKFLESVLSEKGITYIIGDSIDCDLHETYSSLNDHYKNLGFDVKINEYGECKISKHIQPYSSKMSISKNYEIEK